MRKENRAALERIVTEIRRIADEVADEARENASNNSGDVYDVAATATALYLAAGMIDTETK